jgi:hypothetical protein
MSRLRDALLSSLCLSLGLSTTSRVAACPESVTVSVERGSSSSVVDVRFDRNESLHGTALAFARGPPAMWSGFGCVNDPICVAHVLATAARREFAASGCRGALGDNADDGGDTAAEDDERDGIFDVVQVGSHVGDHALDPIFGWLRHRATCGTRALLVEVM